MFGMIDNYASFAVSSLRLSILVYLQHSLLGYYTYIIFLFFRKSTHYFLILSGPTVLFLRL